MLPTLGADRQATYSPFMPISPRSGQVLQVPVIGRDLSKGTITYKEEDGEEITIPVTGGHCKLQWKPDFGMRWAALDVDYEMYGKDHQPPAELYTAICKIAGGNPPEQYVYEMFLDAEGKKISKSKGNGISMEQWLRYGPPESLSYYMFQSPRKAKRLYFDVIPRAIDDYQTFLEKFAKEEPAQQLNNPVWHIHGGKPPKSENIPGFNLLLNLAGVSQAEEPKVLWGYIRRYRPQFSPEAHPFLDQLVQGAVHYYHDFIKPTKKYRLPNDVETQALAELADYLETAPDAGTRRRTADRDLRNRQAASVLRSQSLVFRALRDAARPAAGAAHGLVRETLRQGRYRAPHPPCAGQRESGGMIMIFVMPHICCGISGFMSRPRNVRG